MTTVRKNEIHPITESNHIVLVRQVVRQWALQIGLGIIDQTKIVTAASELARNTLEYGHGGHLRLEELMEGARLGLRLTFEDQGPGIPDLKLALTDGYTSGGGLGMGLSGSRRLVNEFAIESEVGKGTKVTLIKWKNT